MRSGSAGLQPASTELRIQPLRSGSAGLQPASTELRIQPLRSGSAGLQPASTQDPTLRRFATCVHCSGSNPCGPVAQVCNLRPLNSGSNRCGPVAQVCNLRPLNSGSNPRGPVVQVCNLRPPAMVYVAGRPDSHSHRDGKPLFSHAGDKPPMPRSFAPLRLWPAIVTNQAVLSSIYAGSSPLRRLGPGRKSGTCMSLLPWAIDSEARTAGAAVFIAL